MSKDITLEDLFLDDIPKELPAGTFYEYYRGLSNRELWLDSNVDIDEGVLLLVKQIIRWNREDKDKEVSERKPIILYCFSLGGDIDLCNSIIDTISCSKTPVYTVNVGRCMSAAAYIYISGHKRFMFPKSYFLFHQGSGSVSGSYSEVDSQMEDYKKKVAALTELMKKYTKYQEKEISKNIKKEWYVSSDEAIKNGVCDKIIESLDELIF